MNENDDNPLSQANWKLDTGWLVGDDYVDVNMEKILPSEGLSDMIIPAGNRELLQMIEAEIAKRRIDK